MNKLLSSKYSWVMVLAALIIINMAAQQVRLRIDMTSEKKYSLSAPTRSLLKNIEEPVTVDVLLTGEFPAVFRKLQNSTNDVLNEMKAYAGNKLIIRYSDANAFISDEEKQQLVTQFLNEQRRLGFNVDSLLQAQPNLPAEMMQQMVSDSLKKLGILPYNLQVQQKENESSQRIIFPSALIRANGKIISVDLLSGKTEYSRSTLTGRLELDEAKSIGNAEALLEFKFADAIAKIQRKEKPVVAYLIGNGEPMGPETYDLVQTIETNYQFNTINPNTAPVIPKEFAAVLIVKPSAPFSDSVKMKLDQYVMQGGKLLWFVDMLYAEKDSLAFAARTLAYDRGLNLDDLLFKYGVRINRDLLQNLPPNCDLNKLVVGNAGGQPQLADVPFNYYPLLTASANHPITKNSEGVLAQFANTIDTVKAEGISKHILLSSSENSKTVSTPAIISLEELKTIESPKLYNKHFLPVGVLLEGKFSSFYANRASAEMRAYFEKQYGSFLTSSVQPTQQLIVADGDLALNGYTKDQPFTMGYSPVQDHSFANKTFLQNTLEYMTGNAGIISLRNKDVAVRLLNKEKVESEKLKWQLINIAAPVVLVILGAFFFTWWRKKKYASTK
ncbi:MAG: gliding motility-associated ABC transporter substrate-binding protein GldG [Chitinophagaceae bacterium]|nr:gliding motility-associated ABC transporter substrate-binding protein GldG [Chitinophagaceae bacterium]